MWLTAWPGAPMPVEHPTEQAAEAHTKWLVDSRATEHATYYRIVLPDEETQ